jgi:dihydrofolate reductase
MLGMIAAVSPEWVIGLHGTIPWHHPGDMRRFKRVTKGATVIMGRGTWESMDKKPLPGRRNVVITRSAQEGVECFPTIGSALATLTGPAWFIGGARIYEEAMQVCDVIDLTFVPDRIDDPDAVRFPPIDEGAWEVGPMLPHEDEPGLFRREYRRRGSATSPPRGS